MVSVLARFRICLLRLQLLDHDIVPHTRPGLRHHLEHVRFRV